MTSTTPLTCPKCGGALAADDVNVGNPVATCPNCGRSEADAPPEDPVETLQVPPGIRVRKGSDGLEIRWSWFGLLSLLMLFSSIFWCLSMLAVHVMMTPRFPGQAPSVMMVLLPIIQVLLSLGLFWITLAYLLNTSTITVNDRQITVTHGPIPWFLPKPVPTEGLDQITVVRKRGSNNAVSYLVRAQMKDGNRVKLLGGIGKDAQARYIKQSIEAYLGIEDRPIRG